MVDRKDRQHRTPTKQQYIDAAVEHLNDSMRFPLTGEQIAKWAGTKPRAFWDVWDNIETFTEALIDHVLDPATFGDILTSLGTAVKTMDDSQPLAALTELAAADFAAVQDKKVNDALTFLIATAMNDESRTDRLRDLYRELDQSVERFTRSVLDRWERKPVSPLQWEDLAVTLNCLIDGFAIRARFDPKGATAERYTRAVLALMVVMTRDAGQNDQLADRLAVMDEWAHPPAT